MNKTSLLEDEIRFEDVPGKYIDRWIEIKNTYSEQNIKTRLVRIAVEPTLPKTKGLCFYYELECEGYTIKAQTVIDLFDIRVMYLFRQRKFLI